MRYLQIKIKKGALTLSNGKRAQTVGFLLPCSSVVIHLFRQLQRMYPVIERQLYYIIYMKKCQEGSAAFWRKKAETGICPKPLLFFKKIWYFY